MNISYDYAKLSPSMSRERLVDNFNASIFRLAKKQMAVKEDMLEQLLDSPQINTDTTGTIDVKI